MEIEREENKNEENDFELSDFIAVYPELSSNVKDFQTLISAKKEFQELASSIKEPTPIPGVYYKHQELILRYMRAYDRLLLLHKTGTGKTCAFDAVIEYFKRVKLGLEPGGTNLKKAYIFTRGDALVKELRKQIACKCNAQDVYITEDVKKSTKLLGRNKRIHNKMKEWYEIIPYGQFVNKVLGKEKNKSLSIFTEEERKGEKEEEEYFGSEEEKSEEEEEESEEEEEEEKDYSSMEITTKKKAEKKGKEKKKEKKRKVSKKASRKMVIDTSKQMTDDEIRDKFSNCIFVIDEVHNLRNNPDDPDTRGTSTMYEAFHKIFHLAVGTKIILASATPMINSAADIVNIMNLILPEDQQLPQKGDYANATLEQMSPYI